MHVHATRAILPDRDATVIACADGASRAAYGSLRTDSSGFRSRCRSIPWTLVIKTCAEVPAGGPGGRDRTDHHLSMVRLGSQGLGKLVSFIGYSTSGDH